MHSCLLSTHVHTAAVHPLGDVPILFAPICGETCVCRGLGGPFRDALRSFRVVDVRSFSSSQPNARVYAAKAS